MHFLRDTISFPTDLSQALTNAIWGKEPDKGELARVGKALGSLWEKLAVLRGQEKESHYSFRRDQVEAYSAYYLPANALKPALILEEASRLGLDLFAEPSTWLDLGTGPGTAYWGLSWWAKRRQKKLDFIGWDQSDLFVQRASSLARKSPFGSRATFLCADGKKDWIKQIRRLKPTHVSFVNSIAEIFPDATERLHAIQEILSTLRDLEQDGKPRFLIVIEPGSKQSSRELSTLKDAISAENSVLLPCLDNRKCGALVNPQDWCHEECSCEFPPWVNELGSFLKKEALIFSYLVVSPRKGLSLFDGAARIVSQRLEQKGQVECYVCTGAGKRKARVQRSKATDDNKFLFSACRGDIFTKLELAEKGDIMTASPPSFNETDPLF